MEEKSFNFEAFLNDRPRLRDALENAELLAFDFEGTMMATEVVMQISFFQLLRDQGKDVEFGVDIYDIEEYAVGKSVRDILKGLTTMYQLKAVDEQGNLLPEITKDKKGRELSEDEKNEIIVEALLERRKKIYVDLVNIHDLKIFPSIAGIVDFARHLGKKCVIPSNGVEGVIKDILKKAGLIKAFGDDEEKSKGHRVFASDSEIRKNFFAPGDKALCLAHYAKAKGISPDKIVVFEDNAKHIANIQKAFKTVFGPECPDVKFVYIRHEFNYMKEEPDPKNVVAYLDGPAPEQLCKDFRINCVPPRGTIAPSAPHRPEGRPI